MTPDEDPGTLGAEEAAMPLLGVRPLAALLRRARAWEMESRELAARSSSSESERQMGSDGDEGLHADAGKAGEAEVDPTPGAGLCVQTISVILAAFGVGTILFLPRPVRCPCTARLSLKSILVCIQPLGHRGFTSFSMKALR